MIRVLGVGASASVQDLGRIGYGHLGVPQAGAVDPESHRLANRLLGNSDCAATLELLMGSTTLGFASASYLVTTGAPAPVRVNDRQVPTHRPVHVPAGSTVRIGRPAFGLWTYVAVRGGIGVQPVLGSRATDTLSGLGPAPVTAGMELPIGVAIQGDIPRIDFHGMSRGRTSGVTLHLSPGPRYDWLSAEGRDVLVRTTWTVSPETNRIASRLEGPALPLEVHDQLPTEGLHPGSIQLPSSGIPIVHLANHPPTGGYPVVAIVDPDDIGKLAQAVPGTPVHFVRRLRAR